MKYAVLIAATAALSLSACKKSEEAAVTPEASETAVAASEAAPTPAVAAGGAAAFTAGEAPTKEFMVGTWGEGDACEMPIQFQADGTIKDGPFEKWDIVDGALMMEGAPQKMKLKVIDEKTMESQLDGSDKTRTLKRC